MDTTFQAVFPSLLDIAKAKLFKVNNLLVLCLLFLFEQVFMHFTSRLTLYRLFHNSHNAICNSYSWIIFFKG